MGWKFRKRIKIAPGVNINLSRKGVSATVGAPGASVNIGKKGAYLNTGIPGTGIYDRQRIGGGKKAKDEQRAQTETAAARDFKAEIENAPEDVKVAIMSEKYFKPLKRATILTALFGCLGVGRHYSTEARWLRWIMWIIPFAAYAFGVLGGVGVWLFVFVVAGFNTMETVSVRENIRQYNAAVLCYLLDGGSVDELERMEREARAPSRIMAAILSTVFACVGGGYFYVKMWKAGVAHLIMALLLLRDAPADIIVSFTMILAPFQIYFTLREIKKNK